MVNRKYLSGSSGKVHSSKDAYEKAEERKRKKELIREKEEKFHNSLKRKTSR